MSLYNYLVRSGAAHVEIRSAFCQEEIQSLYSLVKETGYKQHRVFVGQHLQDILRYIEITDSQRTQKRWLNHPQNLLIRLAALQISAATLDLQNNVVEIDMILDRGSYRKFHAVFANALAPLMLSFPLAEFPFEGFDNPFLPK